MYGPTKSSPVTVPTPGPLPYRQFGPAWIADCYGTTHEQRLAAIDHFVDDPDAVAVSYARLLQAEAEAFADTMRGRS